MSVPYELKIVPALTFRPLSPVLAQQIANAYRDLANETVRPADPARWAGLQAAITAKGEVRTHPAMLGNDDPRLAGLDGFYAVVLVRP